ncbi:MAG: TRAP transporter small permease [Candidatus Tectomicrobia bacterium]|nr:TRAP transporter small permease [Candidatus Tectomicrobia bacterium]
MPGALRRRWEAFDAGLARFEGAFLAALLIGMVGVGFLQVVLRNLFHTGIFSADLLLRQGMLWLGLAGASLATRGEGRHIHIDVLSRAFPAPWSGRVRRLADLCGAAACFLLARASLLFVAGEWEAGSRIAGAIPAWALQAVLPLGFALMALRFLAAAAWGRPPKREGARP